MAQQEKDIPVDTKMDTAQLMQAAEWHGKKSIKLNQDRPIPLVTDASDVILHVTSTCICGSDLHLYLNAMPGMKAGDIMGHEFMGVVHEVGPDVKNFKVGDRVVACFDIACGQCFFCKDLKLYTCCNETNPSEEQRKMYGDRTAGFFGHSHLTGGWLGGQAEFVKVPFADINLLKLGMQMKSEQWLLEIMWLYGEPDLLAYWQHIVQRPEVQGKSFLLMNLIIGWNMQRTKCLS